VFSLLRHDENDLTAALGFAMARCQAVSYAVLSRIWPVLGDDEDASFALEVRAEVGRTDLEVRLPATSALLIFEAKRDWLLPALAATQLPSTIEGVPVVHLPWRMRTVADSLTYSVVLSEDRPGVEGGTPTFREIVTEGHCYFHPYGVGGWPTDPHTEFMAFRWAGAVQRIHRVMQADVVPTIRDRFPYLPVGPASDRAHAVYDLGRRIPPLDPIPNGAGVYPSARLWVLLDQLPTAPTLKDAISGTRALQDNWSTA
jgi:hypothetical protein